MPPRRPRIISGKRSTGHIGMVLFLTNCEPHSASVAYCALRGAVPRPAISWHRFTAASPKGSRPPTCKRQNGSSTSWVERSCLVDRNRPILAQVPKWSRPARIRVLKMTNLRYQRPATRSARTRLGQVVLGRQIKKTLFTGLPSVRPGNDGQTLTESFPPFALDGRKRSCARWLNPGPAYHRPSASNGLISS